MGTKEINEVRGDYTDLEDLHEDHLVRLTQIDAVFGIYKTCNLLNNLTRFERGVITNVVSNGVLKRRSCTFVSC